MITDEFSKFYLDSTPTQKSPERRLLTATLARAIHDIFTTEGAEKEDALDWLRYGGNDTFSYRWICLALDLEPVPLFKKLMEHMENGFKIKKSAFCYSDANLS